MRVRSIAWLLMLSAIAASAFAGNDEDDAAPFDIRYQRVKPGLSSEEEREAAVNKLRDSFKGSHSLLDAIKNLVEHRQLTEAVEIVQTALTQAGVSIVDIGNDCHSLPILHLATMKNERDVIEVLLALDRETVRNLLFSQTLAWNGSEFRNSGETALMLAVSNDRVEAAKLMLAAADEQGQVSNLIQVKFNQTIMGKQTIGSLYFYVRTAEMQKILDQYYVENAETLNKEGQGAFTEILKTTGLDKLCTALPLMVRLKINS